MGADLDTVDLTNYIHPVSVTVTVERNLRTVMVNFVKGMSERASKAIMAVFNNTSEIDPTRLELMAKNLQALAGSKEMAALSQQIDATLRHLPSDKVDNFMTELVALAVDIHQEFRERRVTGNGGWVLATHYEKRLTAVAEALLKCSELLNQPLGMGEADKQSVQTLNVLEATVSKPVEVTVFLHKIDSESGPSELVAVRVNMALLAKHLALLNTSMSEAMRQQAALLVRGQGEKNLEWLGYVVTRIDKMFMCWFGDVLDRQHAELRNKSAAVLGNALRGGSDGASDWITLDQVRSTRGNLKRLQKTALRTASDCGGSMDGNVIS